jgi:diacylglycerol kinase family enzyme
MSTRIAVIFNAGSGKTSINIEKLHAMLRTHQLDATVISPKTGAEVPSLAASLVRSGHEIVVAAGGDGTVSAVACALAGSVTILGILPLGSLNHFARDVRIPLALPEAVRNLAEGRAVNIDVGEVNGRVFINNISLGLYPAFVQARGDVRRHSGLSRWYTIFSAALNVLSRLPLLRARVTVDSQPLKRITPLLFIGNNEYELEGASIGHRHRLDAGCLSIIMTRRRGPWGLIRLVVRAALGTLRGAKDLDLLVGREIEVQMKRWQTLLAVDGEVADEIKWPLRCTVRQGALRVLVPDKLATNREQ